MKFPTIELVDRYAIAVVKYEKTNGANREELDFYQEQINKIGIDLKNSRLIELIDHHRYVWSLEDDFKKGRIDGISLEEIGRRAIHIRDLGYKRIELKNILAELINDPVREIKQDHSSEKI